MKQYEDIQQRAVKSYEPQPHNPMQPAPVMVWNPEISRIAIVTAKAAGVLTVIGSAVYIVGQAVIIGTTAVVAVVQANALMVGVIVLGIGAFAACVGGKSVQGQQGSPGGDYHGAGQNGAPAQNINITVNAPNGGNVTRI